MLSQGVSFFNTAGREWPSVPINKEPEILINKPCSYKYWVETI